MNHNAEEVRAYEVGRRLAIVSPAVAALVSVAFHTMKQSCEEVLPPMDNGQVIHALLGAEVASQVMPPGTMREHLKHAVAMLQRSIDECAPNEGRLTLEDIERLEAEVGPLTEEDPT